MKKFIVLLLSSLLVLSACSSADYNATTVQNEPPGVPPTDYIIEFFPTPPFEFEGYAEALDRVYATVDGRQLRFDIFFPTVQKFERTPLVVGFHGGGWIAGNKSELTHGLAPIIAELRANGYAFATVQYRFAAPPNVVFPAPFDDAAAFISYIKENAGIYNIDVGNIGVIGYSAGAHLAMLLAYATDFDIRYCIALAGPTKMYGDDPANYPRSTMALVENLFGGTYEQLPELYRAGSPFFHLEPERENHRTTPLLLVHDRTDDVVPFTQAEIMFEKVQSLGIESEFIELFGVGHNINFHRADESVSAILNFIYRFHEIYTNLY